MASYKIEVFCYRCSPLTINKIRKKTVIRKSDICEHNKHKYACRQCKLFDEFAKHLCKSGFVDEIDKDVIFSEYSSDLSRVGNDIANLVRGSDLSQAKRAYCEHFVNRYFCRKCKVLGLGGAGICEHDCRKNRCKRCIVNESEFQLNIQYNDLLLNNNELIEE